MSKRIYLKEGDLVEVSEGTLKYTGKDYKLHDLSDATLTVWVDEKSYEVFYAYDLSKTNPHYGKPYYEREQL